MNDKKCVLVIDKDLPLGVIANTAAVLALSLGKAHPELVGDNIKNRDGGEHLGITRIPIPILAATASEIKEIRSQLQSHSTIVDFSNVAKSTKSYEDYSSRLEAVSEDSIEYLGIAVYGDKKAIIKQTGNMKLIR
ncbi:DUF2000 domain-containing protein [Xenorhabdus bovienii]|uniref:DUF2000 domain-containing protein n=1 Tax=Xenorhabdus bovienii str. feltiae Moldova TaxID=1398200 RepID=A0A077NSM3_XENBV|nr:DUF2000 domain-containing protein [Xenorhabdus bovienii]CDH01574.1 conserved hypothetical protein [Xenorhabdus bovienii str. feltiae Moldova]